MKSFLFFTFLVGWIGLIYGYGTIPIKYKGTSLKLEEYHKLQLCSNEWCLKDAFRILEEISYNNSENPCDDFDEFSCGTFYKERAYNERYETIGFQPSYKKKIDEKRHIMLKASITDEDVKAVKVVKNFYKRCVTSKYIISQSRKEILAYLGTFGKFPNQISNWTENDLNFTKLETETKLEYFTNFKITYCPSPVDGNEILCLVPEYIYSWTRYSTTNLFYTAKDVKDMFELFGFPAESVDDIVKIIRAEPSEFPNEAPITPDDLNQTYYGDIRDLKAELGKYGDSEWIDVLNQQLPNWLKAKENDKILIFNYPTFFERVKANKYVDKRLLAYVVLIDILYDYRHLFEVYPFENKEYKTAIKTPERFELCNRLIDKFMPVAANAMFSRKYLNNETRESVKNLMNLAIDDYLSETNDKSEDESILNNVKKLKSMEVVAGYPTDLIDDSFLNRLFQKLNLNGSETLVESYQAMFKHQKFINMLEMSEEDSKTLKIGSQMGDSSSCSLITNRIIYCPATAIQYPMFHTKRSVFYNMAMLLPEIYEALLSLSVTDFVHNEQDLAAKSYKKFVKLNGAEPSLPGFLLTNEEMFWVALAIKHCEKNKSGKSASLFAYSPDRFEEFFKTFNCPEIPTTTEDFI